jgi:ATP-dependent RNA helicase HelY
VLAESPDLTPGDFVRSVKQLIDLLDQIAATSRPAPSAPAAQEPAPAAPEPAPAAREPAPAAPGPAAAARAAVEAMRRGVVAYSAVAD